MDDLSDAHEPHSGQVDSTSCFTPLPRIPPTPVSTATEQASVALQTAINQGIEWTADSTIIDNNASSDTGASTQYAIESLPKSASELDHLRVPGSNIDIPLTPSLAQLVGTSSYSDENSDAFVRLLQAATADDGVTDGVQTNQLLAINSITEQNSSTPASDTASGSHSSILTREKSNSHCTATLNSELAPDSFSSNKAVLQTPSSGVTASTQTISPNHFSYPSPSPDFHDISNSGTFAMAGPDGTGAEAMNPQAQPAARDGSKPTKAKRQTKKATGARKSGPRTAMPGVSDATPLAPSATHSPFVIGALGSPFHPFHDTPASATVQSVQTRFQQPGQVINGYATPGRLQSPYQPGPQARNNLVRPMNGAAYSFASTPGPAMTTAVAAGKKTMREEDPTSTNPPPSKRACPAHTNVNATNFLGVLSARDSHGQLIAVPQQYKQAELTAYFNQDMPADYYRWMTRSYNDPEPPHSWLRRESGYDYPVPPVTGMMVPSGGGLGSAEFYQHMLQQAQNQRSAGQGQGQGQGQGPAPAQLYRPLPHQGQGQGQGPAPAPAQLYRPLPHQGQGQGQGPAPAQLQRPLPHQGQGQGQGPAPAQLHRPLPHQGHTQPPVHRATRGRPKTAASTKNTKKAATKAQPQKPNAGQLPTPPTPAPALEEQRLSSNSSVHQAGTTLRGETPTPAPRSNADANIMENRGIDPALTGNLDVSLSSSASWDEEFGGFTSTGTNGNMVYDQANDFASLFEGQFDLDSLMAV